MPLNFGIDKKQKNMMKEWPWIKEMKLYIILTYIFQLFQ